MHTRQATPTRWICCLPQVYDELRRIAGARLRHERADHTLHATEIVHEAFMKLMPLERIDWRDRAHFFAIALRAMRNVLVDHAMRRSTAKRGGGRIAVPLEGNPGRSRSSVRGPDCVGPSAR
jgi:RNA polymerase sigma factor (TIGR02999 family)